METNQWKVRYLGKMTKRTIESKLNDASVFDLPPVTEKDYWLVNDAMAMTEQREQKKGLYVEDNWE